MRASKSATPIAAPARRTTAPGPAAAAASRSAASSARSVLHSSWWPWPRLPVWAGAPAAGRSPRK